jgi:hypothetical protein
LVDDDVDDVDVGVDVDEDEEDEEEEEDDDDEDDAEGEEEEEGITSTCPDKRTRGPSRPPFNEKATHGKRELGNSYG